MSGLGKKYQTQNLAWMSGVHMSPASDRVPDDSSPRAWNASWEQIGDGSVNVRKRRGALVQNTTSLGASVSAQYFFQYLEDDNSFTRYHLLISENGNLSRLNDDKTLTSIGSVAFNGSFSSISAVTANNRMFMVAGCPVTVSGVQGNGLKYDGTTWTLIGLTAPGPPQVVTPTGVGEMTGDYDVALTYYNSDTGHESSRSTELTATGLVSQQLYVSWPAPTDTQIDYVRVYLRKQSISNAFYQAAEIAVTSYVNPGSTTLDISDDEYNALITEAPSETENDPPPTGTLALAWHRNRMFAATANTLYYSKDSDPESFDLELGEIVGPDTGQKIVALVPIWDQLIILMDDSVWTLVGDTPNDFVIRMVHKDVGCVAGGSVVYADDNLFWWSAQGPVVWGVDGSPAKIGRALIWDLVKPDAMNMSNLAQIQGVDDRANSRVMWAIPPSGSVRNTLIIPFKYQIGQFEGEWYALDCASWVLGEDTVGQPTVWLGDYDGYVYRWWASDLDGVYAGTVSGSCSTTTGTISSITSSGFNTSPGLAGKYVYLVSASGTSVPRRQISTNDATTLTLRSPLVGLSTTDTYSFYVGTPDFQFDLKWQDDGQPFQRKRFEFFYLQLKVPASTPVFVDFSYDFRETDTHIRSLTYTSGLATSIWNSSIWDVALWGSVIPTNKRIRVAHCAYTWRARIRHIEPNVPLTLQKVGMSGEVLTDKRGRS